MAHSSLQNSCYSTVPKHLNTAGHLTHCYSLRSVWIYWLSFHSWQCGSEVSAGECFLHLHNSSARSSAIFMRHTSCFTAKECLKNNCKSQPKPWTHSWRGPLSSSAWAFTCCCRTSENMKASHPYFSRAIQISKSTTWSHTSCCLTKDCKILPIKQWKKYLLPTHLHD